MKVRLKKHKKIPIPIYFPEDYTILWKGKKNSPESGLTCSQLSKYLQCRVSFLLTIHRWHTFRSKIGLAYGSLFHYFLEKLYGRGKPYDAKQIRRLISHYVADNSNEFLGIESKEVDRLVELAKIMAEHYQVFYQDDFKKYHFESLEGAFDIEWNSYRLRGKRDGLVRDRSGRLLLWENKNYWQISADIQSLLQFDLQTQYYVLSGDAEMNEQIAGVRYNIIRVPQNKMTSGVDAYRRTITEKVLADPKYYFVRYNVEYTQSDKRRFGIELMTILSELEKVLKGELPIYKNQGACDAKYKCQFIHACAVNSLNTYKKKFTRYPELQS